MEGKTLCIALLLASVLTLGNGECAPPDEIYPCMCDEGFLECSNVNEEELRAVFIAQKGHTGGRKLGEIFFTDYRLTYIPSGLLSGLDFYAFHVTTTSLLSFHDPHADKSAFDGVEDKVNGLVIHYFDRAPVEEFDWNSLSPLKNLQNLIIKGTFEAIRTPLPPLPTVELLSVEETDISFIAENAFAGLTGLKGLSISSNRMKSYSRNMLPNPALVLTTLKATDTLVTELPEDFYENMPVLSQIEIPYETKNIPKFKTSEHVTLTAGIGVTCDCSLKWLLDFQEQDKVSIAYGSCKLPERLRLRELKSLTEKDIC